MTRLPHTLLCRALVQPWNNGYSSAIYNPGPKTYTQLLKNEGGIHAKKNAFCAGQSTSVNNEVGGWVAGGVPVGCRWLPAAAPWPLCLACFLSSESLLSSLAS